MNGEPPQDLPATPGDDHEMGEPIEALRDVEHDTSFSFLSVLRKKIHRRATVSQFLSFSWQAPKIIFVELGNMLIQILNALSIRKGE